MILAPDCINTGHNNEFRSSFLYRHCLSRVPYEKDMLLLPHVPYENICSMVEILRGTWDILLDVNSSQLQFHRIPHGNFTQ